MTEAVVDKAVGRPGVAPAAPAVWTTGLLAAASWLVAAGVTAAWPDLNDWTSTEDFTWGLVGVAAVLAALAFAIGRLEGRLDGRLAPIGLRLRRLGPWLAVLGLWLALWEALTAKLGWLPRPFFAPPQGLVDAYLEDWPRMLLCVAYSFRLFATGYLLGALFGFIAGVAIGWSRFCAYWGHPILKLIGPVPPTAWLPVVFFLFPTTFSGSSFLIALASGIPVTVLTFSGVAGVNSSYYDIARTLGAKERFLVLKVAVPAALPHVFVGLFMGLYNSFAVLVVAEMLGVKAGLGWYLQWATGWAAYANMYAALLIMALCCSGLVSLLFITRDRLLAWQKGLLRW